MVQFCMASLLACLVLDDAAMEEIRQRGGWLAAARLGAVALRRTTGTGWLCGAAGGFILPHRFECSACNQGMLPPSAAGEAPLMFRACISLLSRCMDTIKETVARAAGYRGWQAESPGAEGDAAITTDSGMSLDQAVRMAEAASQAMWGSAHYCLQQPLEVTQVCCVSGCVCVCSQ